MSKENSPSVDDRRRFLKRCLIGGCGLALGGYAVDRFLDEDGASGLRVGFRNSAPDSLWQWSKEADWYHSSSGKLQCHLCPHECMLENGDRGFCRTRVVKNNKLYTLVYGNPCSVHIDPVEKKPLNHFLPGSSILSIATAGCNLRCLYCQNWTISQSMPEETENIDLPPEAVAANCSARYIPSIAYTYSEPIIFYEYVYDTAVRARAERLRNVLVTAGYIQPDPLRKLCKVVDAANVDIKSFNDRIYTKVCGAALKPVLKGLAVMREEGIWIEITNLVVPTVSDDLQDIKRMCDWIVKELGADTPLHFSRFYPMFKMPGLPPTSTEILTQARDVAWEAGLHYVYIGNVPGFEGQNTVCPACKRTVIRREGYQVLANELRDGRCPCGAGIAGVWI